MENKGRKQETDFNKAWSKVIAKTWSDPDFKQRLIQTPKEVLMEYGIDIPAGMECKICQGSEKIVYLYLPEKPSPELEETALKKIAAGVFDLDKLQQEHMINPLENKLNF